MPNDLITALTHAVRNAHYEGEAARTGWDQVAHLKSCRTEVLLQYRQACYKFGGWFSVFTGDSSGPGVNIKNVLAELGTREHIPNKKEARVLRRLMSQNKMTAEEIRAIPKFANQLSQAGLAVNQPTPAAET